MESIIKKLIAENPSGLFKMEPFLPYVEKYFDNLGFELADMFRIYQSRIIHESGNDWFKLPNKTLETLFNVQEELKGNILIVYIAVTIEKSCYLILCDDAFRTLMKDAQIMQVYQMSFKDKTNQNKAKMILVWHENQIVPATVYGNARFGENNFSIKVCEDPNKELEILGKSNALIYHY